MHRDSKFLVRTEHSRNVIPSRCLLCSALEKAKELVFEARTSGYGADDGLPELREALREKVGPD